jgi:flagellar biosynthesis/type III secretory pathway chaperone
MTAFATLAEGLDRQIDAMNSLRVCLEEEHRALQLRDPQQLLAAIERKTDCIVAAERIERQCRGMAGAGTDRDPRYEKKREELDTLTRTCRELNEANGALIRRQRQRVDATLRILRGAPEESAIYGPSGDDARRGVVKQLLASV